MLQGNFFAISHLEEADLSIKATLTINAGHPVFEGHFPGQPVVPGVCMMQMIKELLEQVVGKKTDLVKAGDMKFLAVIDPLVNSEIDAALKYSTDEGGAIAVSATLFKGDLTFFKFKGAFSPQSS